MRDEKFSYPFLSLFLTITLLHGCCQNVEFYQIILTRIAHMTNMLHRLINPAVNYQKLIMSSVYASLCFLLCEVHYILLLICYLLWWSYTLSISQLSMSIMTTRLMLMVSHELTSVNPVLTSGICAKGRIISGVHIKILKTEWLLIFYQEVFSIISFLILFS